MAALRDEDGNIIPKFMKFFINRQELREKKHFARLSKSLELRLGLNVQFSKMGPILNISAPSTSADVGRFDDILRSSAKAAAAHGIEEIRFTDISGNEAKYLKGLGFEIDPTYPSQLGVSMFRPRRKR